MDAAIFFSHNSQRITTLLRDYTLRSYLHPNLAAKRGYWWDAGTRGRYLHLTWKTIRNAYTVQLVTTDT